MFRGIAYDRGLQRMGTPLSSIEIGVIDFGIGQINQFGHRMFLDYKCMINIFQNANILTKFICRIPDI